MSERENKESAQIDERVAGEFMERLKTTSVKRTPMAQRLSAPKTTDLGPQIVGQPHSFAVELPKVMDPNAGAGHASASVEENHEFANAKRGFIPMFPIAFGDPSRSFDVRFTPSTRGHFSTSVDIVASWEDGHAENVKVPVTGAGRELTDARVAPSESSEIFDVPDKHKEPQATKEQQNRAMTLGLFAGSEAVNSSLEALFGIAGDAVNEVGANESQYKGPLPSVSIWVHLAQIAIEAGLSLLSEELGNLAGKELARVLGHAAAEAHEHAIEVFGKGLGKAVEASVKESKIVEIEGEESGEKKKESRGSAESAQPRASEKHNILLAPVSSPESSKHAEPKAPRFFAAQKDAITLALAATKNKVTGHVISLAEALGPDSDAVNTALSSTRDNVDGLTKTVRDGQANASLTQWMNALARADLGVSSGPNDRNPTTMLDDVRLSREGDGGRSARGLLEIHLSPSGDAYRITGARVNGISSASAELLLDMDLRKSGLPIVIRAGAGKTITVDEAGRIRSEGRSYETDGPFTMPSSEAKDDLAFTELVTQVLARPLAEQGVKEIETDARTD